MSPEQHERVKEQDRQRQRVANMTPEQAEKRRAATQAWRAANAQKAADFQRRYRAANPDKVRPQGERSNIVEAARRRQSIEAIWIESNGCCYLCGDPVPLNDAVRDHDHACCPRRARAACGRCWRGITHDRCNRIIGIAGDDPDLLARIASNLRTKLSPAVR